ncbi:MAG: ATP synthase F1 subunit delta [Candidatus Omnitrophica bacterium]|nr:ATP synthase F1 subunit delta [Candidatus Omnitrophota bacterium]
MLSAHPVASRYAQALFESAKAEGRIDDTLQVLTLIGQLLREHQALRQFMLNPDVEPDDKVELLDRLMKPSLPDLVKAFLKMTVVFGRADALPDIVEAFRASVDDDRGLLRAVVRSAYPIPEALHERLRLMVAALEHKQVELEPELDPALVGGVQICVNHRVIDGSIQRQLTELRQRLRTIRVP